MSDQVTLTIEGRQVSVDRGKTILDAANEMGVVIPTFCWDPRLKSIASCRMCLVEVEKAPKLVASCATPAADGMIVHVNSEKAINARKAVLEFILANHPLDCPTCDKGGECILQDNSFDHGGDHTRTVEPRNRTIFNKEYAFDDHQIGPVIWLNMNRCIKCYKCTRIIKEIAGDDDLGAYQRGYHTIIHHHPDRSFRSEFSGNTVEYCPVGALVANSFRYRVRSWLLKKCSSVCHLCGDGCNTTLWYQGQKLFRVYSRWNRDVDDGLLCDRGRYGALYADSDRRLKTPKIRKEGKLVDSTWDEALTLIAEKFKSIIEKHGGKAIAVLGNEMMSNEEAYLLSKISRQTFESNNIDFRFDDRFTPSNDLNLKLLGIASDRVPFNKYEDYDNILVIGADTEVKHPIQTLWIKKAVSSGKSKAFSAYHKRTDFTLHPVKSIEYFPQGEYNFLLAFYHALKGDSINEYCQAAGVNEDNVKNIIDEIESGNSLIIVGEDLYNNPNGKENIDLIMCIRNLLGNSSKVNILFDGANYLGNMIWGTTPDMLPGGIVNNQESQKRLADKWGVEKLPDDKGMNTNEMLDEAIDNKIEALLMIGSDIIGSYPDRDFVSCALNNIGYKVICETFLTETGKMCDVVLPLAAFPEYNGSMISSEGRLQSFEKAFEPAYSSAEGWRIILRLAQKLGFEDDYNDPKDIWKEITSVFEDYTNISHSGLNSGGLLPGFKYQESEYIDPSSFKASEPPQPSLEYPLILTYGASVYQKRHLTYYAEAMDKIDPGPRLYIHPDNAKKMSLQDNDTIRIQSEWGNLTMKLSTDDHIRPGTVFIPVNYIEAEVNSLLSKKSNLTYVKVEKL
ncbi:MAG: NADH-quinone oxidoreductase subunit NuoG [candidate division Zixibacteria bacterium]|nr:NADH-quinone oxidoreductase subunit NuoG [candidate division Zixibacteria bacterium]